jgi:hypothetical protein
LTLVCFDEWIARCSIGGRATDLEIPPLANSFVSRG